MQAMNRRPFFAPLWPRVSCDLGCRSPDPNHAVIARLAERMRSDRALPGAGFMAAPGSGARGERNGPLARRPILPRGDARAKAGRVEGTAERRRAEWIALETQRKNRSEERF